MSFPSNAFRLEGAAVRNSYQAGRDLTIAVTSLESRVTAQQLQIASLTSQLLLRETENNALAARLATIEAWALQISMVG
jgi:hypothetical protein